MPARAARAPSFVALCAVSLAVVSSLSAPAGAPWRDGTVVLDVQPVPLDASETSRETLGPLRYMGGLWLRSADPRFGGLSDLRVSPDGVRLFAVSDCGHGFTATLSYDARGRLAGVADVRVVALASTRGGPLGVSGADAESLVLGERLEVGFEGRTKVLAYSVEPVFAGPALKLQIPAGVARCGSNSGIEAMADAGEGRRLLVCEGRRSASSTVPAWIGRGDTWQAREYPLDFEGGWAGEPFRPTGAALLPDGDVMLVERRFPPIGARLVRLPRASLDGTGPLSPREMARLEAPLTLDNFEGLEARRDSSGRTLLYLLSDDNNCAKNGRGKSLNPQRTLLLMFSLRE